MAANHDATSQTSTSVAADTKLMARHAREGNNDSPVPIEDTPANGNEIGAHNDHSHANCQAERKSEPEALQDLGHLEPEVGPLHFFLRRTPGDIVREEVREDGLAEGDGEAAEEEEAG